MMATTAKYVRLSSEDDDLRQGGKLESNSEPVGPLHRLPCGGDLTLQCVLPADDLCGAAIHLCQFFHFTSQSDFLPQSVPHDSLFQNYHDKLLTEREYTELRQQYQADGEAAEKRLEALEHQWQNGFIPHQRPLTVRTEDQSPEDVGRRSQVIIPA